MPWLPNVILGVISFLVAMVTLLLPETRDWPLPQSIADVYRYTAGVHRDPEVKRQRELDVQLSKMSLNKAGHL